ncbi:GNAT family N-acetyltransferase [Kitasatospora sp. NPDC051914]|uniref:GNAT family N-acetyltransferase n=1 Tax=Kitasatospora sp. NPDC051914 TaxID=3154945 RepID=UPI003447E882
MDTRSRLELANDNAAAFWLAQARSHGWEFVRTPHFTAVRCDGDAEAHRVVVTRPYGEPESMVEELVAVLRDWRTARLCLEDPYARLDLRRHGCEASLGQAVMAREPDGGARVGAAGTGAGGAGAAGVGAADAGAAGTTGGPQLLQGGTAVLETSRRWRDRPTGRLTVGEALDADDLAEVERTVIDGFPMPARLPHVRGSMLPPGLLQTDGYRAWLARLDGRPAGACISYDDGTAVGIYSVATLPEHRSRGVGRAVVAAALAAHPDRVATLVATLLGEPLYRRLGFTEYGVSRWWRYPATPSSMTV